MRIVILFILAFFSSVALAQPLQPAVKGPNQSPVATDPAWVVVLGPNSAGLSPLGPGTVATTPSVNIASDQIQPPGQTTMSQSPTVNIASDQQVGDPCMFQAKKNKAIASAAGNTQLVAPVAAQKVYICSYHITGAAAYVYSLIEGTGAACTTANELAITGSTTASAGESLAANGQITQGNGQGTIGQTATAGNGVCLLQNGTTAIAGNMTYVQQ